MSLLEAASAVEQPEVTPTPSEEVQQEVVDTPSVSTPTEEQGDVPTATEGETLVEEVPVEHPEWFKHDKYESIEKQAEAYAELESKFGAFVGAPEEYELSPSEDINTQLSERGLQPLGKDDPLITEMGAIAKELNMSQDGFNKFASKYLEYQMQTEDARIAQAIETIGAPRINKVAQWGKANLSETEFKLLEGATSTAEGVEFVELMMKQLRGEPDLSHKGATTSQLTKAEIVSMQSKPEYRTDAAYRAKVSTAWEDFFLANPNG